MLSIPAPTLERADKTATETDLTVLAKLMADAIVEAHKEAYEPNVWVCFIQQRIGSWGAWAKRVQELVRKEAV
jgi:hypothetical protein